MNTGMSNETGDGNKSIKVWDIETKQYGALLRSRLRLTRLWFVPIRLCDLFIDIPAIRYADGAVAHTDAVAKWPSES